MSPNPECMREDCAELRVSESLCCSQACAEILYLRVVPAADESTAMKSGKLMMELVDLDFIADMALQLEAGLTGDRVPNGWQALDPGMWLPKYRGAGLRHHLAASPRGMPQKTVPVIDPDTGASHWAAVAVNAMICWGLERRR